MFSHLNSDRLINIQLLQEQYSKQFVEILEKCDGTISIVWDEQLTGPCGLLVKNSLLQQRNVVENIIIRDGPFKSMNVENVVFITRPELHLMDSISENILSENGNGRKSRSARKEFYIIFLPRQSTYCKKHLQNKGVLGSFKNIFEIKCDFFPIDNDLISMELKDSFTELLLNDNSTILYQAACGIVSLQKIYGRIPKIYGKGNFSAKIWEYAKSMGRDEKVMFNSDKGLIDQLIIIDRSIDIMSVLATQLTYEGLIDERFGVHQTTVNIPVENFSKSHYDVQAPQSEKIILNSSDELFAELRDKNFNEVGKILSRHAKDVSFQLEERHNGKSVADMKKFVEKLPNLLTKKQSVQTQTRIAEIIKSQTDSNTFLDDLTAEQDFMSCMDIEKPSSYIEDLIAKKADISKVIRLICMQCIASSGFKPKILDFYKRELIHVYGIEVLLCLSSLEKCGVLKTQTETRPYAVLRKTLNLTVDEVVEIDPKDISYVHSFYAPLNIRIVEQCLKPLGWQSLKSVLNILPGQSFEDFQAPLIGVVGGRRSSLTSEISHSEIPRVILVFFIGGCTFAEISALRFLSQHDENNIEFLIATTGLVNKNSFINSFVK